MTAAEWDALARLAEAATPGPWEARRDDLNDEVTVVHDQERVSYVAGVGVYGMPRVMADAEFIAAANPATILRLIKQAQNHNAEADRHASRVVAMEAENEDLTAERDALAARLAAVEALADEWDRRAALAESTADARAGLSDEVSLRQHAVVMSNRAHDLRAALAAPTDTTKEN